MEWTTDLLLAYERYAPWEYKRRGLFDRVLDRRLERHPRRGIAKTRTGLRLLADTRDLIQRNLYGYGDWARDVRACVERLKPGETFIDVGANIGYFSLLAAQRGAKAVAIEPSPSNAGVLRRNANLNRLDVKIVQAAAGAERTILPLYSGTVDNVGASSLDRDAHQGSKFEANVLCDTLPQLVGDDLGRARLIKIDVQGFEYEVVQGLLPALTSTRADLEFVVEVNTDALAARGVTLTQFVAMFPDYQAYYLDERWPSPFRSRLDESALAQIHGEADMLLSPIDVPAIKL